jgi:hypothetical protein
MNRKRIFVAAGLAGLALAVAAVVRYRSWDEDV